MITSLQWLVFWVTGEKITDQDRLIPIYKIPQGAFFEGSQVLILPVAGPLKKHVLILPRAGPLKNTSPPWPSTIKESDLGT